MGDKHSKTVWKYKTSNSETQSTEAAEPSKAVFHNDKREIQLSYYLLMWMLNMCLQKKVERRSFRFVLTNSFPMHPFSTPWKQQKTVRVHWERMG